MISADTTERVHLRIDEARALAERAMRGIGYEPEEADVLACPRCGGRLRLLGTIDDPVAIRAILDSLAVSAGPLDRPPPATLLEPAALVIRA